MLRYRLAGLRARAIYSRRSALPLLLFATTLVALAGALPAEAQLRAVRLSSDSCLSGEFTSFDDVVMTAMASHYNGVGDVYQAICDAEECFGFSINRAASVNVLTVGLTPGDYTWFVCAWNGSVRNVVGNLSGGSALYGPLGGQGGRSAAGNLVRLDDERIPDALRRLVARLGRVPRA